MGKKLAQTLDTQCAQGIAIPILTLDRPVKRQNGRRFKDDGDDMFTLTAIDRHGVAVNGDDVMEDIDTIYYSKRDCHIAIRRLTPKECFRLQAFSDEQFAKAEFVNTDSQLYKQAGNSVTTTIPYAIGKAISESNPVGILRQMAVCPECKVKPVLSFKDRHRAVCPICGREASAADTDKLIEVWNEQNA